MPGLGWNVHRVFGHGRRPRTAREKEMQRKALGKVYDDGYRFDGRRSGRQRVEAIIRQSALAHYERRVEILARIADGDVVYRKRRLDSDGRAVLEEFEPTPKDRLYAMELLGKTARIYEGPIPGSEERFDAGAIAGALSTALRDPSVRDWLMQDEAVMSMLRTALVSGEAPQAT